MWTNESAGRCTPSAWSRSLTAHRCTSPAVSAAASRWRSSVLACDPEILILDEPSANLEPVARRELAELLLGLGRTMLMVTHDLPFALQICPAAC